MSDPLIIGVPASEVLVALRAMESRLRAVLHAATDAIITTDLHGRITAWNRAAAHLFGYAEDDALGQSFAALVVAPERRAEMEALLRTEGASPRECGVQRLELEALHRDGGRFPLELSLGRWVERDGACITAVARAMGAPRRTRDHLQVLHDMIIATSELDDESDALGIALRLVCHGMAWAYGEAWIPRPDGAVLQRAQAWCQTHRASVDVGGSRSAVCRAGEGLAGRSWVSRTIESGAAVPTDEPLACGDAACACRLEGALAVPVLVGNEVVAVLAFSHAERSSADDSTALLLRGVAAQLGAVVRRGRLARQVRDRANDRRYAVQREA